MSQRFTLSPEMLAAAFPFHFVVDHNLKIVQAGDVLQRICNNTLINEHISTQFQIHRPRVEPSYSNIQKRKKSLFILKRLDSEIQLKGQFIPDPEEQLLFFLGSPWVTSIDSLSPLKIKLKDFAIHDPIVDFVFLLQASQTSLNETRQLAEELTQQQAQLKNTLSIKENLKKVAEAQARRLEETLKNLKKTQGQLIQTEKMSSLGQMVAGVAHEINNPVNFIHANLEYVTEYTENLLKVVSLYQAQAGCTSDKVADFSDEIDIDFLMEDFPQVVSSMKMGTKRIREIVASLKTFSRLDEAQHKVVDIHCGIDSTLLILKHRFKETEIAVHKAYGDLPEIECYAGQLNQVFMNLLSNAIDALSECEAQSSSAAPDGYAITITTQEQSDGQILIAMSDNGPGIPEDIQTQLFDPFFTTKPVGKGTGLGLSISYQIIVDKHAGKLWCDSKPGEGTTFYIQLPQFIPLNLKDRELIEFQKNLPAPEQAQP